MERSRSHHHFSYSALLRVGLGDMNELVASCLAKGSRLDYLLTNLTKALKEVKRRGFDSSPLLESYVELASMLWTKDIPNVISMNSTQQVACGVIASSLYFHHIYRWNQMLGKKNILVIEGERLTLWRSAKKIAMKKQSTANYRDPVLSYTGLVMSKTQEEEIANIFRSAAHFILFVI